MLNLKITPCIQSVFHGILYFCGIVLPTLIEGLLVGLNHATKLAYITIFICSLIQSLIVIYLGILLWYNNYLTCTDGAVFNTFTKLTTTTFLIYCLPVWVISNMICAWINDSIHSDPMPFFIGLSPYGSIVILIAALIIILIIRCFSKSGYQQI